MPCSVYQNLVHCASPTYSNQSLKMSRLVNQATIDDIKIHMTRAQEHQ